MRLHCAIEVEGESFAEIARPVALADAATVAVQFEIACRRGPVSPEPFDDARAHAAHVDAARSTVAAGSPCHRAAHPSVSCLCAPRASRAGAEKDV